jgi:TRAP-type C4-dicarboxylate transport system substrate-binding protein
MSRSSGPRAQFAYVAFAAIALASVPAAAQQTYTMKLGTVVVNDPITWSMDEFKKRIESRTQGRIKAEVYPASQLGTMFRMIEGLQLGTIEMLVSGAGFYASLHPAIQTLDAPGLFDSAAHQQRTLLDPAFRAKYVQLTESKGVVGVSLWAYGGTHYAATKPLRTLADFEGKKFRILASKIEGEVMGKLGATGIPVPFGEMIPAVQQGTIDGIRANLVVLAGPKAYTVAKYITLLEDGVIPTMAALSTIFRDKLPADLRQAVYDVGKSLDTDAFAYAQELEKKGAETWRQNGGEVIVPSAAMRAEMKSRLGPIGDAVLGANPQVIETWELLKQVAEKTRKG